MGPKKYQYITKGKLYLPNNGSVIVRGGRIDISRLYRHIFRRGIPESLQGELEEICQFFCDKLSTCQNDLLRLEFGEKEMTLNEACPTTRLFTDNPVDANCKTLSDVLEILRIAMETTKHNYTDIDNIIDDAHQNGYQQACEAIQEELMAADKNESFRPLRCLASCAGMLGMGVGFVLVGHWLAKKVL